MSSTLPLAQIDGSGQMPLEEDRAARHISRFFITSMYPLRLSASRPRKDAKEEINNIIRELERLDSVVSQFIHCGSCGDTITQSTQNAESVSTPAQALLTTDNGSQIMQGLEDLGISPTHTSVPSSLRKVFAAHSTNQEKTTLVNEFISLNIDAENLISEIATGLYERQKFTTCKFNYAVAQAQMVHEMRELADKWESHIQTSSTTNEAFGTDENFETQATGMVKKLRYLSSEAFDYFQEIAIWEKLVTREHKMVAGCLQALLEAKTAIRSSAEDVKKFMVNQKQ